jgi:hypothetical protein
MPSSVHPIGEDGSEIINKNGRKYLVNGSTGGSVDPMTNADKWVTYEDGSTGLQRTDENGNWRGVPRWQDPGAYDMKAALDYAAAMAQSQAATFAGGVPAGQKPQGVLEAHIYVEIDGHTINKTINRYNLASI